MHIQNKVNVREMTLLDKLPHLGFYYAPPLGEAEIRRGWLGKNVDHTNYLIRLLERDDTSVRQKIFDELLMLNGIFPEAPRDSFAHICITSLAAKVAGPWEMSFLTGMLFWDQILNALDNSLLFTLTGAIGEKGHREDVEALKRLHFELGKPERICCVDGEGKFIPLPGVERLRLEIKQAIKFCEIRGSRGSMGDTTSLSKAMLWSSVGD